MIKVAVISQSQDILANTDTVFEFTLSAYSNIIETMGQVTGTGVNSDISIIRLYATANKFVVRSGTAQTVFVNCMVIYK